MDKERAEKEDTKPGRSEGTSRKIILILCLTFIVLGIIYTYPLVSYFSRGMPYSYLPAPGYEVTPLIQGDYLQLYYKLWLFKDAAAGRTAFFTDPYQFSVDDAESNFSTQFLPMSLLFLVFSVFGNTFAYNSMMIFSFLLSGLGAYLLVHFYTRDKCSAIFGAIIFTLAPFRTAHLLAGHPGGFLACLMPLSVYFLEMGFSRKSYKYGVFSGLCILSLALIELHLTYYIFLFMGVFILFRSFQLSGEKNGWWKGLMPVLFFIFLSVVSVLLLRSEKLAASTISSGREWTEIRLFSPAVGDILRRNNKTIEKYIYPGIVPLLLVIAGLFYGFFKGRVGKPGHRPAGYGELAVRIFYGIVLLVSLVLALGPSLDNIFPIYRFCHKYVPYYNFSRTPGRIMVLAFLSISILAGFGAKWIKEWKGRGSAKHAILAILMLGILIDYHPLKPVGISLVPGSNEVYKTIEDNIGKKRLLELPIWPGDSSWSAIYLYNAARTRARLINGYSSTTPAGYVQDIFFPLYNLDFGEMRENQYNLLKDLNVKYVTLHEDAFPYKVSPYPYSFSLRNLKGSKYLKFIAHDHPTWLFELLPAPSGSSPDNFSQSSAIGTLYEAERLPRKTGIRVEDSQASGEYAVFGKADREKEGHLLFGPYRTFPTGKYNVTFRLKTDGITKGSPQNRAKVPEALKIDICTDKGQTILAEKILRGTDFSSPNRYQDFVLPVDLDEPQRLEFRVYHYGNAGSWADYVYILFRDREDPENLYEAEDLFHIGRVEADKSASGGRALFAESGREPRDYLISGPNRRYPEGKYEVSFYLKTQDTTSSDIARIEAGSSRRKKIIASGTINGTDFADKNAYQRFALPFELHKPEILEFLVFFTGKSNLAIDKVEVSRDEQ